MLEGRTRDRVSCCGVSISSQLSRLRETSMEAVWGLLPTRLVGRGGVTQVAGSLPGATAPSSMPQFLVLV